MQEAVIGIFGVSFDQNDVGNKRVYSGLFISHFPLPFNTSRWRIGRGVYSIGFVAVRILPSDKVELTVT